MNPLTYSEIEFLKDIVKKSALISIDAFTTKNFSIHQKIDGSKVTSVDIEVSKFINSAISQKFPNIPIICEEGGLRNFSGKKFFLIDPIDGTSSFAKGIDQFCINLALIDDQKPVFGIINAPLFEGGKIAYNNKASEVLLNEKVVTNKKSSSKNIKIVTSSRLSDDFIKDFISENFPSYVDNFELEKISSAVKFFRILENKADLYFHSRPSMEWDTAAGQVLVELFGAKMVNLKNKKTLTYNKSGFLNEGFLVSRF